MEDGDASADCWTVESSSGARVTTGDASNSPALSVEIVEFGWYGLLSPRTMAAVSRPMESAS